MPLTKVDDRGLKTPIDLQDNEKIRLGTGNDLEIYHDGTYSRINSENHMFVIGTDLLHINNGANNESQLRATANGSVDLYYDNSKKFETTSAGATVTGDLGLGTTSPDFSGFGSNTGGLEINDVGSSNQALLLSTGSNNFYIANNASTNFITGINDAPIKISTNGSERLRIESDGNIKIPVDNKKIIFGDADELSITHTGSHSDIVHAGAGRLRCLGNYFTAGNSAGNEDYITANLNGAVKLYYDNSQKFETTSDGVTSNEKLKVEGDHILIDNDGDSMYRLSKNGTAVFSIRNNSTGGCHLNTQNDAILAFGVASGSSPGTVNSDLRIVAGGNTQISADNKKLQIGASQDLELSHDGTDSIIDSNTGALKILSNDLQILKQDESEFLLRAVNNGTVRLYFDGSEKLSTTSEGIKVTTDIQIEGGSGDTELKLKRTNTAGSNGNAFGSIKFLDENNNDISRISTIRSTAADDGDIRFETRPTGGSLTERLRITSTGNIEIPDNAKLGLGSHPSAGGDLLIWHNGSDNFIDTRWNLTIRKDDGAETLAKFNNNASVDLYYDDSKKLETTSTGIQVANTAADVNIRSSTASNSGGGQITFENVDGNGQPRDVVRIKGDTSGNGGYGELTLQTAFNNTLNDCLVIKKDGNVQIPADSKKLQIGANQALELWHGGSYTIIKDISDSPIFIQTDGAIKLTKDGNTETYAVFNPDSSVDLYYDGSKKFETTSTGVDVTGSLTVSGAINENVYAITDGNAALDPDNGMIQTWTLGANRTASDSLTAGQSMLLVVTAGSYTLTFPTISWAGGSAPTLSTSKPTAIELFKIGSTLYGALVGDLG